MKIEQRGAEQSAAAIGRRAAAAVVLEWNFFYRAGRSICRKALKIMFWEVPPADWLIL